MRTLLEEVLVAEILELWLGAVKQSCDFGEVSCCPSLGLFHYYILIGFKLGNKLEILACGVFL